jgi:beta-N-acetylhexosaminidase
VVAVVLAALALAAPPKPHIVWKPVPFGATRLAETAAYAKRHYGIDSYVLHPRAIVEHVTATPSFSSAYDTFANDAPDAELHELPGTCAHFIVDHDIDLERLLTNRFSLDQAKEAYQLFDTQTTGKGVFVR